MWGGFSAVAAPIVVLRPTRGLAGALDVLLAIVVGFSVLNLLGLLLVEDWGSPTASGVATALQGLTSTLSGGANVALVIVFCIWLYRTLWNARVRHPEAGINAGWAVGSFFVPVAHLVLPYFEVRRGWRADVSPDARPVTAWFVPWALALAAGYAAGVIAMGIALRAARTLAGSDGDAADVEAVFDEFRPLQIGVAAVTVPLQAAAAWFLSRMARRWTALQEGAPAS